MKTIRSICATVGMLWLALSTPLVAKPNLSKGPLYIAEADRSVPEGRAVQIALETPEIGASIELGRVAELATSGSNGYYYWSVGPLNEAPALARLAIREADVHAEPLRKVMQGFDGSSLVGNAIKNGIKGVSWLAPNPLEVLGTQRMSSPLDFVYAAPTSQVVMISAGYYLSPDCSQIEVRAEIRILKKVKNSIVVVAFQQMSSVVQLPNPSFDPNENVRRWSANDGADAKWAVAAGSARLEKLVPLSLQLSQSDIAAFAAKNREMAQAAGRFGPVVERAPDGPGSILIWSKGLVDVQPLRSR